MPKLLRRAALAFAIAISLLASTAAVAVASPITGTESSHFALARGVQPAAGDFTAGVDFPTLRVREVRGNKCEFTVRGTLTFTGTLTGTAVGTTTAVIFAPCAEATTTPPGTFFDVFRFEGAFIGTVVGSPVTGDLAYAGVTRVGGAITATIILRGDRAKAVLRADARVAVGGSYAGVAKVA